MNKSPTVYISYCGEECEHTDWALFLTSKLLENGVSATIDVFETQSTTTNLYTMRMKNIKEKDYTILILSQEYARKADMLTGGVGFETTMLIPYIAENMDKIIPIMRTKTNKSMAIPFYLKGIEYIDFSADDQFENSLKKLLHRVYKVDLVEKPKLGRKPELKSKDIIIDNSSNRAERFNQPPDEINNTIAELINRFISIYEEHGIGLKQMPSFIDKKFDIRLSDLSSPNRLLEKMSDELIDWTCKKFGIQRRWFDDGDKHIYNTISCYKEVYKFYDIISKLIDEVGIYGGYDSKIHAYALKDFKELNGNNTETDGKVLFIVEVQIGEVSTGYVYKYIIIRDNLYWSYWKCRRDAKKIIAICSAFNISIDGYDVPKDVMWRIGYDNLFPYKIIKNLHEYTWIPEEYLTYNDYINDCEKEELQHISESIKEYRKKVFDLLEEKKEKFMIDMCKKD